MERKKSCSVIYILVFYGYIGSLFVVFLWYTCCYISLSIYIICVQVMCADIESGVYLDRSWEIQFNETTKNMVKFVCDTKHTHTHIYTEAHAHTIIIQSHHTHGYIYIIFYVKNNSSKICIQSIRNKKKKKSCC